jgi:arylsulfatase A-like enzyme
MSGWKPNLLLFMNRRHFLQSLTAAAAASSLPHSRAQGSGESRPNILLLLSDQHRHDWVSANPDLDNGRIVTPNLDWMAAGGMRFEHCVVASPLCGPSRACLASGVTYERCGMIQHETDWPWDRLDSFYRKLRDDAGYHVLVTGKHDLDKNSNLVGADGKNKLASYGFSDGIGNKGKWDGYNSGTATNDPWFAFLDSQGKVNTHKNDYNGRTGHPVKTFTNTNPTPLTDEEYNDNWLSENARTLIDAAPSDKPWFCQVNFGGPHEPNDITQSMWDAVQGRDPYPGPVAHSSSISNHSDIRRNYTAMIENIDRQIGLFRQFLETKGQLSNTLIIYASDHGEMLGDHNRWEKKCPYQPSVAVPLYIRGPGVQAVVVSDALVSLIDLGGTALELSGLKVPAHMQSKSLKPVLSGATTTHRDYVISGLSGWRTVFDGRYKLIRGFNFNHPAQSNQDDSDLNAAQRLFDLQTDPHEQTDIAAANAAKVKELSDILDRETQGISIGAPSRYR